MSSGSSRENSNESQAKKQENENDKFNPKVKIGKDIYIFRTLYLITNYNLFKNKNKKQISFFLKSEIKEKSMLYLPKPREKDIIIENIRELIELVLSLCILTNSYNYKISVFTSSFNNIENNSQLLKYTGQVLYAKINEFKNNSNNEENKILQTNDGKKFKNYNKINSLMNKIKTTKDFPSINLKQVFSNKKFGFTFLRDNSFKKKNNKTNYNRFNYIYLKNEKFENNPNESNSSRNRIKFPDNTSRYENNSKTNFMHNPYINSLYTNFEKKKLNCIQINPLLSTNFLRRSNSDFSYNSTTSCGFPPRKLKYSLKKMNRTNSQQMLKSNAMLKSTMASNNSLFNRNTNFKTRTRNKFMNETKKYEPVRFTYFSKENKTFIENSNKDFDMLNSLFFINKKYKKENILMGIYKRNQKQIQNIKLVQNFLNKPPIITNSTNVYYSEKNQKFKALRDIFIKFKKELKEFSTNLDEYIFDKVTNRFFIEIDDSFKSLPIDLTYCLKEYFLYVYFDDFLKQSFPEIIKNNSLYDLDIKPEQIKEIINSLSNFLQKLKGKNKFDLVEYVRQLDNLKSCSVSSDFFQIFIFCPDYLDLQKREITKKFLLVLEIDCVQNQISIDNFINYYYIFRYSHIVKVEQKILFINKLLHSVEAKGDLLQDKISVDIEYLFKIDNRAKQLLMGKLNDIKLNFHQNFKINEIFNSIINYFNE